MKIAITGKGGVGKTTVSSILSRLYADEGYRVLAVDADPDANLALALGFTKKEIDEHLQRCPQCRAVQEKNQQELFHQNHVLLFHF